MQYQAASDASFYSLVHYVLEARRPDDADVERRADERHVFTSLQFVAPYRDGCLPNEDQFQQVLCKDLSPGGLSFAIAEPPDSEFMVVALGSNAPIFLSAAVVRREPIRLGRQRLTLVVVRFIARIKSLNFGPFVAEPPAYAAAFLNLG